MTPRRSPDTGSHCVGMCCGAWYLYYSIVKIPSTIPWQDTLALNFTIVVLGIFTPRHYGENIAPIGRTSPHGPPSSGSASQILHSHPVTPSNIVPCVVLASSALQRLRRHPGRCAVRRSQHTLTKWSRATARMGDMIFVSDASLLLPLTQAR